MKEYKEEFPKENEFVIAIHPDWADSEYNPEGFRMGVKVGDLFISSKFDGKDFVTDHQIPLYWFRIIEPYSFMNHCFRVWKKKEEDEN